MAKLSCISILLALSLSSCQQNSGNDAGEGMYFNIRGFIGSEVAYLDAHKTGVIKTVISKGTEESQEQIIADWKTELLVFSESGINDAALRFKYRVDTLSGTDQTGIVYSALDKNLLIRKVKVTLMDGDCMEIRIDQRSVNDLYSLEKKMVYRKGEGYTVTGKQSLATADHIDYVIKAVFID